MRLSIATVLLLAGCDSVFGLERDGVPSDAAPDAPPDAPAICLGGEYTGRGGLFGVCVEITVPDQILPASINTDDVAKCTKVVAQTDSAATEVCVIAAPRFDITRTIRVEGQRPLVLVAIGDLVITSNGAIDVKSRAGSLGAGASESSCNASNGTTGTAGTGGAGGGFGAKGGAGGPSAATPGAVGPSALGLSVVRGGCRGGIGGMSPTGDLGGRGGDSGGAVYLIAGGVIQVAGTIEASGDPGGGGDQNANGRGAGGGGGGSGGFVGLDAPMVEIAVTGELNANGGGGGGGGGTSVGRDGEDDNAFTGIFTWGSLGGAGGVGAGTGSMGGQGASVNGVAGGTGSGVGGGGGGGGGSGFIRIYGQRTGTGTQLSPSANL